MYAALHGAIKEGNAKGGVREPSSLFWWQSRVVGVVGEPRRGM